MNQRRIGPLLVACVHVLAAGILMGSCASPPDLASIGPVTGATDIVTTPTRLMPDGPIRITVMDAILRGLENNRALRVQRMGPAIQRTYETQTDSAFDPVFSAQLSQQKSIVEQRADSGFTNVDATTVNGSVSLSKTFATGTKISLDGVTSLVDSSLYSDELDTVRGGISITQSILKGGWRPANLASLRQAQLDTLSTEYELRGYAEAFVGQVESTYWDYALAHNKIDIYSNSLSIAEQQFSETKDRIAVGKTAALELSAAEAEVASRQTDLINARSTLEKTRLRLLHLLSPAGSNIFQREILLLERPAVPEVIQDGVEAHVEVARHMRPDLNQARLALQRGTLEVVKTRNGLLPKLDLFVNLGRSGYADSFGAAVDDVNGDFHDAAAGVMIEYPLGDSDAEAKSARARLGREQAAETLDNMQQLVEVDVRSAYAEVQRAREEVAAVEVLVKRRQDSLRAENEKFSVNKSTTLLVAQAQRDLLASQIQRIQAVVSYLQSFIDLYRLEGSLLQRRGISAPGNAPVVNLP